MREIIMAKVSSKGQVVIPLPIREILHIKEKGEMIGFKPTNEGILIRKLAISETEETFGKEEWKKLEKLASKKGKRYSNAKSFLKVIEKL